MANKLLTDSVDNSVHKLHLDGFVCRVWIDQIKRLEMKILCVIPSRLNSTRLPRKALLPINGKPMVQCVYENAMACPLFDEVIVATDHIDIASVIANVGGKTFMTRSAIQSGTLRVAEVAKAMEDYNVIVNLQGDEPFVTPTMLTELLLPYLKHDSPDMATLAYPLAADKVNDPGAVKVITDLDMNAIYFSRAPIPFYREDVSAPVWHHIGVYAFKRSFLRTYRMLTATPLELAESLEQLRAIENGYKIRVSLTNEATLEVNTPEDYEKAKHFKVGQ